jgi:2-iminobutanoate/2-iminopropanoate deaminase
MRRRNVLLALGSLALLKIRASGHTGGKEDMKQEVKTDRAPKAIGPYSQGIIANGFVFCSGQIPLDPASGDLSTGSIEEQARLVLKNLGAVLTAAGSSFDRVVKTTIFLTDLGGFAEVNEVYARFFTGVPPARATVQVTALPRGAGIEIEAVALMERRGGGEERAAGREADPR